MATISVGAGNQFRPYRRVRVQHFPEDASQSFIVGDVLIFSATSAKQFKVKIAGADPSNVVGVAAEAASGVENTMIAVYVADEKGEFRINYGDTQVSLTSDLGVAYGLVRDATNNIWRLDNTETSNTIVIVTEFINGSVPGDTNAEVAVKFLNTLGNTHGTRQPYHE